MLKHQCVDGNVEMWADVKGYEGRYQVSTLGRVKSIARMRRGKSGCEVPVPEIIMALTPKKIQVEQNRMLKFVLETADYALNAVNLFWFIGLLQTHLLNR